MAELPFQVWTRLQEAPGQQGTRMSWKPSRPREHWFRGARSHVHLSSVSCLSPPFEESLNLIDQIATVLTSERVILTSCAWFQRNENTPSNEILLLINTVL